VVALPLAWLAVFVAPLNVFMAIVMVLLTIGTWEFSRLADLHPPWSGVLLFGQVGFILLLWSNWDAWAILPFTPFRLACLAWLLMLAQLLFHRPGRTPDRLYRVRGFLSALGVVTFGWMSLTWLRSEPAGQWWLLTLLLIIWAADTGAYFTGRALGGRKLAPVISPGKTLAGLWGGLFSAAVTGVLAGLFIPALAAPWAVVALIAAVTALISVGGDLFISMYKRTVGLKDSGNLFPGHGGVLDRLDSLLASAPFFALGKLYAGL